MARSCYSRRSLAARCSCSSSVVADGGREAWWRPSRAANSDLVRLPHSQSNMEKNVDKGADEETTTLGPRLQPAGVRFTIPLLACSRPVPGLPASTQMRR